jgi:mannobiose 2-epimerase
MWRRFIVVLAIALVGIPGTTAAADATLRDDAERQLRANLLEVWFPRVLDKEHGGFLCDFDWQWRPAGKHNKGIVYQARQTWVASKAVTLYPNDPRYAEAARHGFACLRDVMWDGEQGGWYFRLDRAGKPIEPGGRVKHAYGISFGIYACAAYHAATKDPQGLDLAKKGFDWLDSKGHDARHGGYWEYFDRDGRWITTPESNPAGAPRDSIGTRIGFKSMNTHIHLLEAFTELFGVWPDARVKQRLDEVFHLVRDRITVAPGAMHQFFNPDWTPVPDVDSFGHDIETAYLLIEAAHALHLDKDELAKTDQVAKSMLDHALDIGWDNANGGFFETGGTFGPVHDKRKVWWSQAEGLNALLIMARHHPADPRNYRSLFEKHWAYVKKSLIDEKDGEWYPNGLDGPEGNPRANKANEWKAGYHTGRALMNVVEWLGKD